MKKARKKYIKISSQEEMSSGDGIGIAVSSDPAGMGLLSRDTRNYHHSHSHSRTAHTLSTASLRKKSDMTLVLKIRFGVLRGLLTNLHHVLLGTKLAILFPAVPLAILAQIFGFGNVLNWSCNYRSIRHASNQYSERFRGFTMQGGYQ